MDSLTQAALGAAVGNICWQKALGRKALIAGALLGTLPDLDVVIYPFLDEVQRLYWHRGESHSVWFLMLGSLGFGWFLKHFPSTKQLHYLQATIGVFLIFSTHVIIDLFTVYGTQLLAPFSRHGFTLSNIFIVDPLFTLPLLIGITCAYVIKNPKRAYRINQIGLTVAAFYAAWSLAVQGVADHKFRQALADNNIQVSRQITSAGPFTTLLWRHIAETQDDFFLGYWSVFDDTNQEILFQRIPKNDAIVERIRSTRSFEAVEWFSKGWWFVSESDQTTAKVVDIRFSEIPSREGQPIAEWQWPFAWQFKILTGEETQLNNVLPDLQDPVATLKLLKKRVRGSDGWLTTPTSRTSFD